jgi:hypothetical protein
MNKSDLAAIKIGGEGFTKKWWQKKRAILANGCGVGKGLDAWAKACPPNPDLIKDEKAVEAARKAANDLKTAVQKAKKKCAKMAKDTAAACAQYEKVIDAYLKDLGKGLTEDSEDDAIWKQILVQMPRAIKGMSDMQKRMTDAAGDLKKLEETIDLVTTRAELRNKMPLHGVKRGDLQGAYKALEREFGKIDKFTNTQATTATRIADPVLDLEAKLKTRAHDKDMRVFRKMVVDIGNAEGKLRDALTDSSLRMRKAKDAIANAETTMERAKSQLENRTVMFWESPVGGANTISESIADVTKTAGEIVSKASANPDERTMRDLSAQMRRLDSEMLQINSNLTNLGNIVKQAATETKEFAKDKTVMAKVKEMAQAYKAIAGMKAKMDTSVQAADQSIKDLAS